MGLTRNQRRKRAAQRRQAKLERMAKAHLAAEAQERRAIVAANLSKPRERNFYRGTISSVYSGGHAARAIGGSPRTGMGPKPQAERKRSLGDKARYKPEASWPIV